MWVLASLGSMLGAAVTVAPKVYEAHTPASSFSALADDLDQASKAQNGTRWLSADSLPRTPLEHAAAAIFALHTAGLPFDRTASGAEYWIKSHIEETDAADGPLGGGIHLRECACDC